MDISCLANTGENIGWITVAATILAAVGAVVIWRYHKQKPSSWYRLLILLSIGIGIIVNAPPTSAQNSCHSVQQTPSIIPGEGSTRPNIPPPNVPTPATPTVQPFEFDGLTNNPTLTFRGKGQPNAHIAITDQSGLTRCETTVDVHNDWICTTPELPDGSYIFTVVQSMDGKTSLPTDPIEIIIDTAVPTNLELTAPRDGEHLNTPTPTITGMGEPGATIDLSIDNGVHTYQTIVSEPTTSLFSTATSLTPWSFALPDPLSDGHHSIAITQTDKAGNVGSPLTLSFTIDTTRPDVTINQHADQSDPTAENSARFTMIFSELIDESSLGLNDFVITPSAEPAPNVTGLIKISDTTWEVTIGAMHTNSTTTISLRADSVRDLAGNLVTASASTDNSVTYTVDAPVAHSTVSNDSTPTLTGSCTGIHQLKISIGSLQYIATCQDGAWEYTLPDPLSEGTYDVTVTDTSADVTGPVSSLIIDASAPTVSIEQHPDQADPTSVDSARFVMTANEPIQPSSVTSSDFTIVGTSGTITQLEQVSQTIWHITVTGMDSMDTVSLSLEAAKLIDRANNDNVASTSIDNSVTFDATPPSVTIEQHPDQADPTTEDSARFVVTFSEPIIDTTFDVSDIAISGTSGAVTSSTVIDPLTVEFIVTGMTVGDIVTANLPANTVTDLAGNGNVASSSIDNAVTYGEEHFCNTQDQWTCVAIAPAMQTYGTQTFDIPAAQMFVNSGLYLESGETATISASGDWSIGGAGNNYNHCKIGDLIARIGLDYANTDYSCVNDTITFTAPRTGVLYLGGLTGSDLGDFYGNRYSASGHKTVTVTSNGAVAPTLSADEAAGYPFASVAAATVEVWGEHTIVTLPTSVAQADAASIKNAMDRLDRHYTLHAELQSVTPYHGQPIRFIEDEGNDIGGYMIAGNPIRGQSGIFRGGEQERISRAGEPGSANWGFTHELAHDFTVPAQFWTYMENSIEIWPNVLSCHAFENIGLTEQENYDGRCQAEDVPNNQYSSGGWNDTSGLRFLMYFQHTYGWNFYKQAFTAIHSKNHNSQMSVPAWHFIHNTFENATGEDVTPMFDGWGLPHP